MKHPLSFLGGCLAGALAMYYLDTEQGDRRRAALRDALTSRGQDLAGRAQGTARRAMDKAREMAAAHMPARGAPQDGPAAAGPGAGGSGAAGAGSPGGTAWH